MARADWLRGVETGFGKAGLAIALEFEVIFHEIGGMARMDWIERGERNGREGGTGEDGAERWDKEDRLWKTAAVQK